jgi:hypothetical protein
LGSIAQTKRGIASTQGERSRVKRMAQLTSIGSPLGVHVDPMISARHGLRAQMMPISSSQVRRWGSTQPACLSHSKY